MEASCAIPLGTCGTSGCNNWYLPGLQVLRGGGGQDRLRLFEALAASLAAAEAAGGAIQPWGENPGAGAAVVCAHPC